MKSSKGQYIVATLFVVKNKYITTFSRIFDSYANFSRWESEYSIVFLEIRQVVTKYSAEKIVQEDYESHSLYGKLHHSNCFSFKRH